MILHASFMSCIVLIIFSSRKEASNKTVRRAGKPDSSLFLFSTHSTWWSCAVEKEALLLAHYKNQQQQNPKQSQVPSTLHTLSISIPIFKPSCSVHMNIFTSAARLQQYALFETRTYSLNFSTFPSTRSSVVTRDASHIKTHSYRLCRRRLFPKKLVQQYYILPFWHISCTCRVLTILRYLPIVVCSPLKTELLTI